MNPPITALYGVGNILLLVEIDRPHKLHMQGIQCPKCSPIRVIRAYQMIKHITLCTLANYYLLKLSRHTCILFSCLPKGLHLWVRILWIPLDVAILCIPKMTWGVRPSNENKLIMDKLGPLTTLICTGSPNVVPSQEHHTVIYSGISYMNWAEEYPPVGGNCQILENWQTTWVSYPVSQM